jgi:glutathione S-transferase
MGDLRTALFHSALPHGHPASRLAPVAATLYATTFCPYAWCTRIVLNEKRVRFRVFEVDLKAMQAEFLEVSPAAKVPMLVDGKVRVWESMAINEYLEEKYPDPNLFGDTAEERARVRASVIEQTWNRTQPLAKIAGIMFYQRGRRDDERIHRLLRNWYQYLDELDEHFSGHDWLVLDRYTVADICLYTTVAVSLAFGMQIGDRHCLREWLECLNTRDSVRRSAPDSLPSFA